MIRNDVLPASAPDSQVESSSDMDSSSSSSNSVSIELDQGLVNILAMSPRHSSNIMRDSVEPAKETYLDISQDSVTSFSRSTDILEDAVAASGPSKQAIQQKDEPLDNSSREIVAEQSDRETESQLLVHGDTPKEFQTNDPSSRLEASKISNMILEATSDEQSESDIQRSREPPSDDAYLHVATELLSASPSAITTLENDKSESLDVIQEDTAVQPKGKEDNEDQPQSPLEISDLFPPDQPSSTGLVSPDYATESIPTIPITDAAVELDKPFENSTKGSETSEASALNSISVAPSDNIISAASDDRKHLTSGAPSDTCEAHTPSIVNSEVASKDLTADPNQHEPDVSLELTSKSMIEGICREFFESTTIPVG
ncbi:hypothetical protein DFH28DRAFT_336993 [Melampsora americana]|nr:hypothetical protein DFH28DRAFT_336993 [Melampsora americana]